MRIETAKSKAVKGCIYIVVNHNTIFITEKVTLKQSKESPLSVIEYLVSRKDSDVTFPSDPNAIIQINKQFFAVKDLVLLQSAE